MMHNVMEWNCMLLAILQACSSRVFLRKLCKAAFCTTSRKQRHIQTKAVSGIEL